MATQYTEEFKNDAVRYWNDHPALGIAKCTNNLRISKTTLSIMDLYSRKIISWVLNDTLEAKYVIEAVEKARKRRKVNKAFVMHTDREIQYISREYIEATAGMRRSYSKKAYPWDNACIESFHALLKLVLFLDIVPVQKDCFVRFKKEYIPVSLVSFSRVGRL